MNEKAKTMKYNYGQITEEIARIFKRFRVNSYHLAWDHNSGILDVTLGKYELRFNLPHQTLMISGRSISHPRAIAFEHWAGNLDLPRLGLEREWWTITRNPILAIINVIKGHEGEPAAAVEDPAALVEPARPVDEFLQFQTVVNVTMRDGAHTATV